jgi:DNA invertase Pin-like site-specific DNA recombinase
MTIIGYARVSTTDQDLEIQITALKREGCHTIRSEKRSGTTTEGREELRTVLDFLREGDVLMVTRIDRLARSIGDLQDRGFIEGDRAADRHQHRGRQVFFGHARRVRRIRDNLRRERQLEGIAKAKAAGVYKGRPASIDAVQVRAMKAQGIGASEIAKALKIGRASVYRVLEAG